MLTESIETTVDEESVWSDVVVKKLNKTPYELDCDYGDSACDYSYELHSDLWWNRAPKPITRRPDEEDEPNAEVAIPIEFAGMSLLTGILCDREE